uniref:SJCHGC07299 protein n=1 Tax=Schistosoma japonicum TaxID=6182 RepID=Q5DDB2_SCHJA|nr:SJCHGC07299 protein [Schistosoma japonicum]
MEELIKKSGGLEAIKNDIRELRNLALVILYFMIYTFPVMYIDFVHQCLLMIRCKTTAFHSHMHHNCEEFLPFGLNFIDISGCIHIFTMINFEVINNMRFDERENWHTLIKGS